LFSLDKRVSFEVGIVIQLLWSYKRNLTTDVRFDSAVADVCASTLHQVG